MGSRGRSTGKSVTLPPSLECGHCEDEAGEGSKRVDARPSPIAGFLSRLVRRGRSPGRKTQGKPPAPVLVKVKEEDKIKTTSRSPARVFGATLSRLSMRKREKVNSVDDSCVTPPRVVSPIKSVGLSSAELMPPPRPACSESDLRNITIRRGSNDIPITPLAGAHTFMSEDNLASADCGGVPYRTPSYIRISCALNGYKSPRRDPSASSSTESTGMGGGPSTTAITSTPARNPLPHGRSLVERRLDQLRHNTSAFPGTPIASSSPPHDGGYSPVNRESILGGGEGRGGMGNAACTPTPVKNLIHQFDRLNLCSTEDEGKVDKENVQPHSLIVNEPLGEETAIKGKAVRSLHLADETPEDVARRAELESRLHGGAEEQKKDGEAEVNHNSIGRVVLVSPAPSTKGTVPTASPAVSGERGGVEQTDAAVGRDGSFFQRLLGKTRSDLADKAKELKAELEENASSMSEGAEEAVRVAMGKAILLNGKKLKKFEELVDKHLNPITGDAQPALLHDLEGYWAMVEIELMDVARDVATVGEWRDRAWAAPALPAQPSPSPSDGSGGSDSGRGTEDGRDATLRPSARPGGRSRVAPAPSTAAAPLDEKTKERLEKQKADAEKRRAAMAAAKAKSKAAMKEKAESGSSTDNGGVLLAL